MRRLLLFVNLLLIACSIYATDMNVVNLRCEYMQNPLGVDIPQPRFSWELTSSKKNKKQTARQILVATSPQLLTSGKADIWNSGKINDNETNQILFQGNMLKPFTYYYWKAAVWDEQGKQSAWSSVACFATGAFSANDWKALWIGEPVLTPQPILHSPLLRKAIRINKKIKQALYLTSALGIYEASINGQKINEQIFAPEWTEYDKHHQYQTTDVTRLLQQGENVLAATLANGWYSRDFGKFPRRFLGQLHIRYNDGTSDVIVTDNTWKFMQEGPVIEADFFNGEKYDAKFECKGWDKPGFDDSKWETPWTDSITSLPAKSKGKYILCAQMNEPIKIIDEVKPVSVHRTSDGKYIFDMGQNMVGWCRLHLPYNPKRDIRLRYAEVLNEDGTIYVANLRYAKQRDTYIPFEEESIDYEPRFTYHGFRYVELENLHREPSLDALLGKVIASSTPVAGYFECSDKNVNKLWENIRWTQWGNLISVPTDCPQRDERCGWAGDAQTSSQTAIYNLDMAAFYFKWMRDIRDNQWPDGGMPAIAPNRSPNSPDANSPGYADAATIVPWRLYLNYNDKTVLEQQYEGMKRYIDLISTHNPANLWEHKRGRTWCDWLSGDSIQVAGYPTKGGRVPDDVLATAFYAHSTDITAKVARVLGDENGATRYAALARDIRKAFADKFVSSDGRIEGNTQAGYAIALEYDMIPENLRPAVASRMAEAVAAYDYRISTGILTTAFLMKQLSKNNYNDIAYKLFLSHRFPSWLYMVDHGATTIWERWDSYVEGQGFREPSMNSFNHPSFGSVGEWMYGYILGIQPDENNPGYRHFYIKPHTDKLLDRAKGSYHSINGNIEVSWTNKDNLFVLDATVPVNTEASIVLPDGKTHRVGSGKYNFTIKN